MVSEKKTPRHTLMLPRNAVARREELKTPRVSEVFGVFLDISGYTPFTESIIRSQKERGIGQLVDELDRLLLPAAEAALRWDGNIIAVEGDALLMTFDDVNDVLGFCLEVRPYRKAVARTSEREYPLVMDIGVSHGHLYEYVAGDDGGRYYITAGSALRGAYGMEKHSKGGDIALSFPVPGSHGHEGHHVLTYDRYPDIRKRKEGMLRRFRRRRKEQPAQGYLDSFVSGSLPQRPRSQLLSPVIAFSDLPLIRMAFNKLRPRDGSRPDAGLARDALEEFHKETRKIIEESAEGFVDKLKDENSMFLFGAPRSFEDVRLRAFLAMSKMNELHNRLIRKYGLPPAPAVTGLHIGDALCGPVLGRYTALGASVNLAARLKASRRTDEEDERRRIRFSREMLDDNRVARMVKGYGVDRRRLKGVEDTKTIFFDFSTVVDFQEKERFVLREEELGLLLEAAHGSIGKAGTVVDVIGDQGSGKDRLLSILAQELMDDHETYEIRCSPFFSKDPYRGLFELMKKVYPAFTDQELFEASIGKTPETAKEFSDMLSSFRERMLQRPAAFILNNGSNMDEESRGFFSRLAQEAGRAGIFIAHSGDGPLFDGGERIVLKDLEENKAREFIAMLAVQEHGEIPPEDSVRQIIGRAGGNPQFIAELVKALERRDGRLALKRKLPGKLKRIMLRNVQDSLPNDLQEALEAYSLMHSVALMAPLMDPGAEEHMSGLRERGFLSNEFEFSSDMLRETIAQSMDPRRRQDICTGLAEMAVKEGMDDHRAIFEYYKEGRLTEGNRLKALKHADIHVNEVAYIYLIRDEFFDDAIEVADEDDPEQRRICGLMYHRKSYLVSKLSNDMETMERSYGLGAISLDYLKGSGEEYKALVRMAHAMSRWGRMGIEQGRDLIESSQRMDRGKDLYWRAREQALASGKVLAYLAVTNSFAGSLVIHHKEPRVAFDMLMETENVMKTLPPLEDGPLSLAFTAMFDKMVAEAAQHLGMHEIALQRLERGLRKSEGGGFAQGVLFCKATQAEVHLKMGDLDKAEELAGFSLAYMKENGLNEPETEADMASVLKDVKKLRREDDTLIMHR